MKEKRMVTKEEINEIKAIYTHSAFGIYQDSKGIWNVSEIKYNPMTKQTDEIIVHSGDGSRDMAVEKFKIMVVNLGLIG